LNPYRGETGRALIAQAQATGDRRLIDAIIKAHKGFVASVVKRFLVGRRHLRDDLMAAGLQGFAYALTAKYDPSRGIELSTYAAHWVRHRIQREIQNHERQVRVPVYLQDALRSAKRRGAATAEDAAELTRPSYRFVRDAWNLRDRDADSLDVATFDDGGGKTKHDILGTAQDTPEEQASASERAAAVRAALNGLSPAERKVIVLRFLDRAPTPFDPNKAGGKEVRTLAEVGNIMGLSRERIRQIEVSAKAKLRGILRPHVTR